MHHRSSFEPNFQHFHCHKLSLTSLLVYLHTIPCFELGMSFGGKGAGAERLISRDTTRGREPNIWRDILDGRDTSRNSVL